MSRSKKIFAFFAAIFVLILIYLVYDISSRTTFPGSSRDTGEQGSSDSVDSDTTHYKK